MVAGQVAPRFQAWLLALLGSLEHFGETAMQWRVGVDIGGTFTDLVLLTGDGELQVRKVPSTPADPADGVMAAIGYVAADLEMETHDLLSRCHLFVHGSTVATNMLLEGKGAKSGMIATEGFRDSLEIRRGAREDSWDHRTPFAPVLVPRHLRIGIPGRIDRNGNELEPINTHEIERAAAIFLEEGVESVAVCLINSFLNARHERETRDRLQACLPGVWISVSSEVAPIMGEYERGSTTVVNAYLTPAVVPYLRRLDERLTDAGLNYPMLLVQSNAGTASVDQIAERPAVLLLSGPAAAVGSLDLIAKQVGSRHLISMEIGGTSCDVLMMNGDEVAVTEESLVAGYHVSLPAIDVHTVGAGGGTIARVDMGGLLKVGPQGAGAIPGPACYGLGGEKPTVTDALIILGRLAPGPYAGGALHFDGELAERAVRKHVAEPLQVSVLEAAIGIVSILEQNLLHAVERISIERGHDPRACTLVAAGGAGPMHGTAVARALGCRRVYVPRQAGAYCALGMLNADVRHDVTSVLIDDLDAIDGGVLEAAFAELCAEAEKIVTAEGFTPENAHVERYLRLHYAGQQSSIRVAADSFDRSRIRADFETLHQRMFGHIQPGGALEITAMHVTGVGKVHRLEPIEHKRGPLSPEPVATRRVFCGLNHGSIETLVYRGDELPVGLKLEGPVLIEEQTTTVFAEPGNELSVDPYGNYLIELGDES